MFVKGQYIDGMGYMNFFFLDVAMFQLRAAVYLIMEESKENRETTPGNMNRLCINYVTTAKGSNV